MPKVSVVIPCYNQGKYLEEAVESILDQTFQDFEIIIVDDGSTDEFTNDLLKNYNKPKTRVIHTDNQGLASARNNGIKESKGEYILPLDADDKIGKEYLDEAVKILDENPDIGIVYCEAVHFGSKDGLYVLPEYSLDILLIGNIIFASAFFRKKHWKKAGGYNINMVYGWEDWDFWLSLIELGLKIYKIPKILFYYRITEASMRNKMKENDKFFMRLHACINHKNLYKNIADIRILPKVAQIYADTGVGFNEKQLVSQIIFGDEKRLEFDLSSFKGIKTVRFDPVNEYCVLHINSILLITNDKSSYKIENWKSNCFHKEENNLIFTTNDPHIIFEVPENMVQKVIIMLEYIAIGMDTFKYKDKLWDDLDLQIKEKEGNIQKHIAHIDHLHGVIKEYAKGIQDHSEEIKKLAREIEIRDKHIHEFHSQIDSLKMQVENERLSRQVLLNSRSWKLAAPIRCMFVYVRKLKLKLRTIICSISRQYRLIRKSGLFDTAYYLEQNQDVKEIKINPLAHYIWSGSKEGRDPNPLFDTSYYLDENPDIAESGLNPLAHYIRVGFKEGRDPNPLFDTSYYLDENPDIAESGLNPLAHYMKTGFKDERNPSLLFDISYYLYRNPDVAKSGMNPLLHYIIFGARDSRNPNPLFDTSYYLDENPDVAETDMNPLAHYIKFGYSDRRNPNPLFDASYYLDENPDVAKSGMNPLIHYIVSGAKEGRSPVPFGTPKISIICPVYNVDKNFLHKCICSVLYQSYYYNWELCLVDDGSSKTEIKSILEKYERKDHRIKVKFLKENQGISVASNEAVSLSTGPYLGFLDDDDELAEDALYEVSKVIKETGYDIIYSDETIISSDGDTIVAHYKPDFSPDLLFSHNYITHFLVIRKSLFYDIGGFTLKYDGAQDYDLVLKLTERTRKIHHIPKVLYHWRRVSTSTSRKSVSKCDSHYAGKTALEAALERRKIGGEILNGHTEFYYRLKRKLNNQPLISIIIPFKDESEYLKTCIDGILEKSSYHNFEIIGINNRSQKRKTFELMKSLQKADKRVKFFDYDIPFNFSKINNYAVGLTGGEHIVLMNNDIEIINSDWIECLLEHSQREDVGVVGALLYYPNDKVQHAGVIIGLGGVAAHSHRNVSKESGGYCGRLKVIQNFSAVTGACMMTKKSIFQEVGGFDEKLSHAFNDVDYCLKVREKGFLIVYTPYAEFFHHESVSRGYEDTPEKEERIEKEKQTFRGKWESILAKGDPYYNPNLTHSREDFSYD